MPAPYLVRSFGYVALNPIYPCNPFPCNVTVFVMPAAARLAHIPATRRTTPVFESSGRMRTIVSPLLFLINELIYFPCQREYASAGAQAGIEVYARLNQAPWLAIWSMNGVVSSEYPSRAHMSARCWSVIMIIIFGGATVTVSVRFQLK